MTENKILIDRSEYEQLLRDRNRANAIRRASNAWSAKNRERIRQQQRDAYRKRKESKHE